MANFWFKFEWEAWRGDKELRRCSKETRGFWIDCIAEMEERAAKGEKNAHTLEGLPEELCRDLICSREEFDRSVAELHRTKAANIEFCQGFVKITSRRLLKKLNLTEYNRLKQQERRRQESVKPLSKNSLLDLKSFRTLELKKEEEKEFGADSPKDGEIAQPQPAEITSKPESDSDKAKPVSENALPKNRAVSQKRPVDSRKDHPAIKLVHEILARWPHKDLWDRIIRELGDDPKTEFFRTSYEVWRSVNGNPLNLEKWLFEPQKTGMLPEVFGASKTNGTNHKSASAPEKAERRIIDSRNVVAGLRERAAELRKSESSGVRRDDDRSD